MTEQYPPPAQPGYEPPYQQPVYQPPAEPLPAYPPPSAPAPAAPPTSPRLSPLWQTVVIAFVGLTVSGALAVMSLVTPNLFVPLSLAATLIAVAVGVYAAIRGWRGSQRAAARGDQGQAALIALGSGAMLIVAAVALSGAIWILLLFFL
jgi:hypothetical protein